MWPETGTGRWRNARTSPTHLSNQESVRVLDFNLRTVKQLQSIVSWPCTAPLPIKAVYEGFVAAGPEVCRGLVRSGECVACRGVERVK